MILPRPLRSRLRPDVRDRQTDRRQTASSLNDPPWGRGINAFNTIDSGTCLNLGSVFTWAFVRIFFGIFAFITLPLQEGYPPQTDRASAFLIDFVKICLASSLITMLVSSLFLTLSACM